MYSFLTALLQPYTVLLLLALAGLGVLWRRRSETRRRLWCITLPVVLLVVCSMPVFGYWALASLEWQYPTVNQLPADIETIVVLSGYVFPPDPSRPETLLGTDSQLRCLQALRLYRQRPCLIVVSGGHVDPEDAGPTLGATMRQFLLNYGVASEDIAVEERSRNTFENAKETAELLRPLGRDRIVLVTTASHVPRAVACFEAQGFAVVPSACDRRAVDFPWSPKNWLPSTAGLSSVHSAFHEWAGLIYYKLMGRL